MTSPNAYFIKRGTSGEDQWEDLRFPAQGINPPGAASDPALNAVNGLLEFSGSADNIIAGAAQMPHSWMRGSAVTPHIHVINPVANELTSKWILEYDIAANFGDFVNAYETYTALATVAHVNPNSAKQLSLISFGELSMAGFLESCCLLWKITRLADTDVADDDTAIVVLVEFDIHFRMDKPGTPAAIPV